MRSLKVLAITSMILALCVGQAIAAPKGNQGNQGQGHQNQNQGQNQSQNNNKGPGGGGGSAAVSNKGSSNARAHLSGSQAVHKQQARRSLETNRRREARNRAADLTHPFKGEDKDSDVIKSSVKKADHAKPQYRRIARNERIKDGVALVEAINRLRAMSKPLDAKDAKKKGSAFD